MSATQGPLFIHPGRRLHHSISVKVEHLWHGRTPAGSQVHGCRSRKPGEPQGGKGVRLARQWEASRTRWSVKGPEFWATGLESRRRGLQPCHVGL
jgi:hypothetical protein